MKQHKIVPALGWLSIGLGLTQVAQPKMVATAVGSNDGNTIVRAIGMREISTGIGILSRLQPTKWLWGRVAGDAMDLALLGALVGGAKDRNRTVAALATIAGITAVDVYAAIAVSREAPLNLDTEVSIVKVAAVDGDPNAMREFCANFENVKFLAKAMDAVHGELLVNEPRLVRWKVRAFKRMEATIDVTFSPLPAGRGTNVRVELRYVPKSLLKTAAAKLTAEVAGAQVAIALRRFKQLVEIGDIITTEGQSSGRPSDSAKRAERTAA